MAKILLVDDEDVILSIVGSLLEVEGHEVQSALGGEAAIEMFSNADFDMMISDIRMDPMNGITVLEEAAKIKPEMKSIILSAMRSDSVKQEAMDLGAKAYIIKPFQPDAFLTIVRQVLERNP